MNVGGIIHAVVGVDFGECASQTFSPVAGAESGALGGDAPNDERGGSGCVIHVGVGGCIKSCRILARDQKGAVGGVLA